jgi:hypothetical protein
MTKATVTIPRLFDYSVTAAASELAPPAESRAQRGALKSWKVSMSSRLALMAFVVLGASGALADDMKMPMNGKDIKRRRSFQKARSLRCSRAIQARTVSTLFV